jgi:hypothetical protein
MSRKISFIVISFLCEFTTWDFCASIGVVFGIPNQVVFHPSMDVDGLSIWVCGFQIYWIVSTLHCFNHSFFSESTTRFVFLGSLSLNTYFLVTLLFVVRLTSTTFTSTMIVYVSTTGWTFVTIIDETFFAS